jgi:hypothetical protein
VSLITLTIILHDSSPCVPACRQTCPGNLARKTAHCENRQHAQGEWLPFPGCKAASQRSMEMAREAAAGKLAAGSGGGGKLTGGEYWSKALRSFLDHIPVSSVPGPARSSPPHHQVLLSMHRRTWFLTSLYMQEGWATLLAALYICSGGGKA